MEPKIWFWVTQTGADGQLPINLQLARGSSPLFLKNLVFSNISVPALQKWGTDSLKKIENSDFISISIPKTRPSSEFRFY
jgi:hypothetical protein